MSIAPGHTLSHYRLAEKIGEGGMGVVWKARDTHLDRDVALKVLSPVLLPDDAARRRFRKEALALSRLNHPNIETVFDFDTQDGVDFLVMEFIPGTTLDRTLASGPLPEKEVARLGTQLGEGLAAAHARGVLHRDLKPGNLRVTPDGRVKILDFGLAKLLRPVEEGSQADTMTGTRGVVGTLPYMAPEQLRGEAVDARADLYAAGVVLYEVATGKRPFQEKVATALADSILHKPPPPPGRLAPEISSRLEEVILKCLEKDPDRRYQSAAELLVDLRRLGTAEPAASVAGPGQRRMRSVRPFLIALAVAALAVSGYLVHRHLGPRATPPAGKVMLAVLPFENLSADPDQEYFSDGMTEEMIAQLAQLAPHDLGVIARTSAMHYKGTSKRIDEIGRELGAQYILEGSVRRGSGRVRITAQLIQVVDQTHLWAESYERDLAGVLAIQAEVARRIARSLALELLPAAQARLASARTVDPEAHEAYLRGLSFLNTGAPEKIALATEQLERAVSLDPTYALAYAALGLAYGLLDWSGTLPSREAREELWQKESAASRKALELDPDLAEAHLILAVNRWTKFDWPGAEEEYVRVIQLNPNYALAHLYYSIFLGTMRRFDESLAESQKAFELDPLAPQISQTLAGSLAWRGRDDEAIKKYRDALALSPGFAVARRQLGFLYLRKGMLDEAIAEYSTDLVSSGEGESVPALERAIRTGGLKGFHRWNLDRLKKVSERQFVSPVDLAAAAAGCGKNDEAMSWLEKAYEGRDWRLNQLGYRPAFDELRSDPRFRDLLRRLGLPTD